MASASPLPPACQPQPWVHLPSWDPMNQSEAALLVWKNSSTYATWDAAALHSARTPKQFQGFLPRGTPGSGVASSWSRRPVLLASPSLNITSTYWALSPHPTFALVWTGPSTWAPRFFDSSRFWRNPLSLAFALT